MALTSATYDVDLPYRRRGRCRMSEPVAVALGTRLDQVAAALSTCEARNARAATESQLLGSARRTRPRERRGALDELSVATTASASVATAVTITAAAASATIRATGEARSTRFVTRRGATPRVDPHQSIKANSGRATRAAPSVRARPAASGAASARPSPAPRRERPSDTREPRSGATLATDVLKPHWAPNEAQDMASLGAKDISRSMIRKGVLW
jgi:hypothetical protein